MEAVVADDPLPPSRPAGAARCSSEPALRYCHPGTAPLAPQ